MSKKLNFIEKGRINAKKMSYIKGGWSCDDVYKNCGEQGKRKCKGGYTDNGGNLCSNKYLWASPGMPGV